MIKVLFVCLGNICRSPMAEGVFKKHLNDKGLQDLIMADSCGTSAFHIGSQPDSRMRKTAAERGIILDHQARQLSAKDFGDFNYILPMDQSNMFDVNEMFGVAKNAKSKVYLMREFDSVGKLSNVPDPYYGGNDGFVEVFEILQRSTLNFLNFLIEEHNL